MFKIFSLTLSIFIAGCVLTGHPIEHKVFDKKQKNTTKKIKLVNNKDKKSTDSSNKKDDNFFGYILRIIDKAITNITREKTTDKKVKKNDKLDNISCQKQNTHKICSANKGCRC